MTKASKSTKLPGGDRQKPHRTAPTLAPPITAYKTSEKAPKHIKLGDKQYAVNSMLHLFYKFVCERHLMQERRLAGLPQPWTQDEILHDWPFTNVFRVLDRNTQYVLRHVIPEGSQSLEESAFRVMLFRFFNKIETWELLKERLGQLTWKNFSVEAYENALEDIATSGPTAKRRELYNNAYIIPAPRIGYDTNYEAHLRLIEVMMEEDLPKNLLRFKHLRDAHGYLSIYPSMGDFTSLQMLLDLNMLRHYNWNEDEWVALGPGSRACLKKMFGEDMNDDRKAAHAVHYLRDAQRSWWDWAGVRTEDWPRVSPHRPPGLSMVDIEHALCECEKYSRAGLPELKGARTKVGKRRYTPRDEMPTADIPAHWLASHSVQIEPILTKPPECGEDEYEVEAIVAERGTLYCVRWAGWGIDDDTWEPCDNLVGAQELLEQWNEMKRRILDAMESRVAPPKKARTGKRKLSVLSEVTGDEEESGRLRTRSSRRTTRR